MSEMNRSVDLSRVVKRLANQLSESLERVAMLEVALEDTITQAAGFHQETIELKQELAKFQNKRDEGEASAVAAQKRPGK